MLEAAQLVAELRERGEVGLGQGAGGGLRIGFHGVQECILASEAGEYIMK
jgi:hypothetical protein